MDKIPLFGKVFEMLTAVLFSIVREEDVWCTMHQEMSLQFGAQTEHMVVFATPFKHVCGHCGPWEVWNHMEMKSSLLNMRVTPQ